MSKREYTYGRHTGFLLGDLRGKDHLEDLGVDRRIIIKWLRNTWNRVVRIGLIWIKIGMVAGCCECGNKTSGFPKMRGIF
jgi:hypothetical protein